MISAVGLMSGTSADGISVAWIDVNRKLTLRDFSTYRFSATEQKRIHSLRDATTAEICEANMWLGGLFARAAVRFLKGRRPDVIGSHGQTVYHVSGRATLQIGEPSVIAERTGITTVADFRPRDIAAGGEGAPLVPFFDEFVFGGTHPRALQNIGGIGNVTVVGKRIKPVAFDTGPGNILIDEAVRMITRGRKSMDRNGQWAAKGMADRKALERLKRHPFLKKSPPKSTGREEFTRAWLKKACGRLRPADLLATVTQFTAETIADAYRRWLPKVDEVIVSGGGVHNRVLMKLLDWALFPIPVKSIQLYGFDPLAKEPAAFALLAERAVRGARNHVRHDSVLGKIVPGRNYDRLMKKIAR